MGAKTSLAGLEGRAVLPLSVVRLVEAVLLLVPVLGSFRCASFELREGLSAVRGESSGVGYLALHRGTVGLTSREQLEESEPAPCAG